MLSEIKLRLNEEPKPLPKRYKIIAFGGRTILVKSVAGILRPVGKEETERILDARR